MSSCHDVLFECLEIGKNSTLIDIVNRCNLSKMFLRLTCELREPLLAILKSPSQSDA